MLLGFGEAEDVRPWRRAMAASDSRTLEIPVDTPVLRAGCACSSPMRHVPRSRFGSPVARS